MSLPGRILNKLKCIECDAAGLDYKREKNQLVCPRCNTRYPVEHDIPCMVKGGPENQDWNAWDLDELQMTGNSYYKRAKGELPEKEASKSFARFLKNEGLYEGGDCLLDIGCAAGHFLRSFRNITDSDILYTGIDSNYQFLRWGKEVYGIDEHVTFFNSDALVMPFRDSSFSIVAVNLFHFFPNIAEALTESLRVANKYVIWRTPVGQANYAVKVIYDKPFDEIGVIEAERRDMGYTLYMIYSKSYIAGLVDHLGAKLDAIKRDTDFEDFDNTSLSEFSNVPATKTVNGMQINGSLVLDWHYVVIRV